MASLNSTTFTVTVAKLKMCLLSAMKPGSTMTLQNKPGENLGTTYINYLNFFYKNVYVICNYFAKKP